MKISAPGKTFLIGEYLAIEGGPSLVACTGPRFQLATEGGERSPFHALSPAGRLTQKMATSHWVFFDPHEGRGGLGASSAQFLTAWVARHEAVPARWDWRSLIAEYRDVAWDGRGQPPSGADVVAQACGRITFYDGRDFLAEALDWTFSEVGFTLVRTGQKLATHEHLRTAISFDVLSLRSWAEQAVAALREAQTERFVHAIETYGGLLRSAGLLCETSIEILNTTREFARAQRLDLRAAKGCGAMGADIVLLVHGRAATEPLRAWCVAQGLDVCGGDESLTGGVEVEV